jgi:hypothetical protein
LGFLTRPPGLTSSGNSLCLSPVNHPLENLALSVESIITDLRAKLSELLDPASQTEPGLLSKAQSAWLALAGWENSGRELLEFQPSMVADFLAAQSVPPEVFAQPWARNAVAFVSADGQQWLILARVPAMEAADIKPDPDLGTQETMICYVSGGIVDCRAGSFSLKALIDGDPLLAKKRQDSEFENLLRMALCRMVTLW